MGVCNPSKPNRAHKIPLKAGVTKVGAKAGGFGAFAHLTLIRKLSINLSINLAINLSKKHMINLALSL